MDDRRDTRPRDAEGGPEPAGEDAAVFRVACVGGDSTGLAVVAAVVTLGIGALALVPTLGAEGRRIADAPVPAVREQATSTPDVAPVAPEAPPVLAIHTRAWGPYVYVQGDVFGIDTEVVVVSIRSPDDAVLQVRTVSMPGGSTAFRLGANDRFQLAFEVAGLAAREVAYVHADAYNRVGLPIASAQQRLSPPVDPGWWRGEGAR